jgi:hypothetical protein
MGKDYRPRMIALLGIEEWRKRQREQLNRWRANNLEKARATSRRNRKKYRQRFPEKIKAYKARYAKTEKGWAVIKKSIQKWQKTSRGRKALNEATKKYQSTPSSKIVANLRARLNSIFKRKVVNNGKVSALFGCSAKKLKSRIESLWPKDGGMSWENYGRKKGIRCWHIDHIVPYAHFIDDFRSKDPMRIKKATILLNHYTNLFPLWEDENYAKSDTKPKWVLVLGKSMWSDLHEKAFNSHIPEAESDHAP